MIWRFEGPRTNDMKVWRFEGPRTNDMKVWRVEGLRTNDMKVWNEMKWNLYDRISCILESQD